ncbi:MAG: MotA/TolQ/ExbB proton channel family protein [Phycisphaeraceae bacterium]|nr:MotA/TolQ/ExbB proton channel family protein [Phycisphaeraceae bacterium]
MNKTWWLFACLMLVSLPALGQSEAPKAISAARMYFWSETRLGVLNMLLLEGLSVAAVALIVRFVLQLRRSRVLPTLTYRRIEQLLAEHRHEEALALARADESYLGRLVHATLSEAPAGFGAMERAMVETADVQTAKVLRPIEYLNVIGNLAPMLGLFGTIYGMIVAFQALVAAGGRPEPADLAAGISTALVTTFWGLLVAMPALAAYALLRNWIDTLSAEALVMAEKLISRFSPPAK